MSNKETLLLFFNRPREPCFVPKGENNTALQIPDNYYPEKYKAVSNSLADRYGNDNNNQVLPVRNIALPDLSVPQKLPYYGPFSLFVPSHRKMAAKLIDIFMGMRNVDDLISVCSYCQLRINPYMFNYCLSVAMLHRPDTKGLEIPTLTKTFPDKFMDPKVFRQAREVATTEVTGARMPVVLPVNYTASDLEPEQRVAYFREDIGVNLHHWHWHLVYPFESANRAIVAKDRRGELLYYMHQQIVARYDVERFCNNLGYVTRYNDFRAPIAEGYFPKLDSQVASRAWPPRFANTTISDLNRPVDLINVEVATVETWRTRILQAIDSGSILLPNGRQLQLTEETGIDVLGDLLEASMLSRNPQYYGDFHNLGHIFTSYAHDPDHRHLEQFGVMGDPATAMRDPLFYRWHAFIDDVFNRYKATLPPYGTDRLDFPSVSVLSVSVQTSGSPANSLQTSWQRSSVELGAGLDFTPRGSVTAVFTHLQHRDFTYVIECDNQSGRGLMGTVRLFMAPVTGPDGANWSFEDQRRHMIELDKFTQNLRPGANTIRRSSTDSSVTIPYERTFQNQSRRPGAPGADTAEFDFCGCGWPHHMLIPKGTQQGFPVVIFAMISDWNDDMVQQEGPLVGSCNDAASYCGIRDRKYPDRRAMGYPFDRPARPNVNSLADFMTPNMAVQTANIFFTDAVTVRGQ